MVRTLAILVLLLASSALDGAMPIAGSASAQFRPNFVVIIADDLDSASVAHMPAVNQLLVANGATFSRFFATTPLCCPSRSSILRGQYAHNHGVLRNTGDDAGFAAFHESGSEAETIATTLDDAGYETALIGKYLNGYALGGEGRTFVPPGWDYWAAGVDHAGYNGFNYDLNINGSLVRHGRDERDYMTDVLTSHALTFLDQSAGASQPFFLYLAPYAPHSPSTPAPRHRGQFAGASATRSPSFNERNIKDKPGWVRTTARLGDEKLSRIDSDYRRRLESLLAVDDMVDAVVRRLDEQGLLESTYVFFLSDNGYFMGEHRQPHGKDAPYDAASRVPLIVRGPDVPANATVNSIALNIDLFPTVVDLAGLTAPSFVDGRSLEPLALGADRGWRTTALLEGFGKETEYIEGEESSTPPFRALRSEDTLYVEYETGERELYNLRKDPHQLSNLANAAPKALLRGFSRHLKALASCAGRECQRLEDESLPRPSGQVNERPSAERKSRGRGHGNGDPIQRHQEADSPADNRRVAVGGDDEAVASLQLATDLSNASAQLRVHVASVESPGTLVAALETASQDADEDPARRRERLAGVHVEDRSWVTLDISNALGDSRDITVALRGRDAASLTVSTAESANPPDLVSGHAGESTDRGEDAKPRARKDRERHRNHDGPRRANRQRGR